jgi:hypothetical protein
VERSLGEEPACSATVSYVGAVLTPRAGGRGAGHVNREMPEDPPPSIGGGQGSKRRMGGDGSGVGGGRKILKRPNGDHLVTSFECDLCHFRNCCGRDPHLSSQK